MTYIVGLVHKEEDSSFGVQFPDVPGCFSAADEKDDLVAHAAEALSQWAEDAEMPEPRSIEEIVKDKAVMRELAAGAFLVSVPLTESDTRVVSTNSPRN